MLVGDIVVFSVILVTFAIYRSRSPGLYHHSRETLSVPLGVLNTLVLLTSSWLIAMAVHMFRKGNIRAAFRLNLGTIFLGVAFIVIKIFEYSLKIKSGINIITNEFYTFYFMTTGIHLAHVVIGIAALIYMLSLTCRSDNDVHAVSSFECGALFWHFVDLIWVIIIALLYLTG